MSSDVYCAKHLPYRSMLKASFWLVSFTLFNWILPITHATDAYCCPKDTLWQNSTSCGNNISIRLKCPYGMFEYNQKNDNFTVVDKNGSFWLLVHYDYELVPRDRFCIVDLKNGERIALSCFDEPIDSDSGWKDALFSTLTIISATFLIATLVVYIILPELRDNQGKALMSAIASLAVGYTVLAIQRMRLPQDGDDSICITLAFLLYYAFMAAFFWLNTVAFNIWRSVWFKQFIVKEKTLFAIFCIYGWGCPTCFFIAALITHHTEGQHLKPRFGEYSCWFAGSKEVWAYFYGPIAVLLLLNVIYLGLTSWRLWHEYRGYSGCKIRVLRFKCLLYVKLVLVTGITWIFEVLSFAVGSREYWLVTDIFNTLQGLVIFLLLVVTRRRVRKLLAKKNPCGINFPKSWVAYDDEECEDVLPEEVELSQQG